MMILYTRMKTTKLTAGPRGVRIFFLMERALFLSGSAASCLKKKRFCHEADTE